jgi:hypothetical protein
MSSLGLSGFAGKGLVSGSGGSFFPFLASFGLEWREWEAEVSGEEVEVVLRSG